MKSRKSRERELHKKLAVEYDAKREGTRNGRFYSKSWLKHMLKFLPKRKLSILEVGCGTALLYEVIQEGQFKHKYTGTDFSPDMVKVGKKRYKGINLKVDDAENMSFKDNSFDVVIMKAVLHHIPHPEKAVSEMRRVCKKGGIILISEPNRNFMTEIPRWLSKKLTDHFDEDHTHYSRKELARILKAGGLKEYKLLPFGYTAYPFGFTDILPGVKYLPLFIMKAFFVLDLGVSKIPLVNRVSWHYIVLARK